jgi:hypothetical protein
MFIIIPYLRFCMASQKYIIISVILVVAVACLTIVTATVLSDQQAPTSQGLVTSTDQISVFNDQAATDACTSIDWGTIDEGASASRTIYVENTGNCTQTLHMLTSNWQPASANSVLVLSWDKEGAVLEPGVMVEATLSLIVAWDVGDLDAFDFNLVIEGSA